MQYTVVVYAMRCGTSPAPLEVLISLVMSENLLLVACHPQPKVNGPAGRDNNDLLLLYGPAIADYCEHCVLCSNAAAAAVSMAVPLLDSHNSTGTHEDCSTTTQAGVFESHACRLA